MKKFYSTLILAAALLFAAPASAQFKYGIKGGLNVSQLSGKSDVLSSDNRTGWFAGAFGEFTLPIIGVGVELGVQYENRGKVETETITEFEGQPIEPIPATSASLQYIDIPLNIKWTYGFSSLASVYIATGPQFAFNVGNKSLFHNSYSLKNSEFSWNVGLGATLIKHLRIGYNYNIGIGNTAEVQNNPQGEVSKMLLGNGKSRTHQISVAYIF